MSEPQRRPGRPAKNGTVLDAFSVREACRQRCAEECHATHHVEMTTLYGTRVKHWDGSWTEAVSVAERWTKQHTRQCLDSLAESERWAADALDVVVRRTP